MDSLSVYNYLQEVFPQIDARLLKAVSIENSNDADEAVEVVLSEILPYLTAKPTIGSSGSKSNPNYTANADEQSNSSERLNTSPAEFPSRLDDGAVGHIGSSASVSTVSIVDGGATFWDANDAIEDESCENFIYEEPTAPKTAEETTSIHFDETSQATNALISSGFTKVSGEVDDTAESEELIMLGMSGNLLSKSGKLLIDLNEIAHDVDACTTINDVCGPQIHDYDLAISCQRDCYTFPEIVDLASQKSSPSTHGSLATLSQRPSSDNLFEDQTHRDAAISEQGEQDSYTFPEIVDLVHVCHKSSETGPVQKNTSAAPSSEDHDSCRASVGDDFSEINNSESEAVFVMDTTRSAQTVEVDLLEQIIEDAKSNKKTLFSAMESVMKAMKEVEEQERSAEQAREEASLAGLDSYSKVEELQNALARAKETNDMHAGEVYGERAILATEVGELQSRLLCLSDERDMSLAILDEMRSTSLENRLAVAEKLRHDFECEKLVKEESALLTLREEEALMEKVVQESKRLQEEAEENTKLQEFLMDRGRVVDALQGEIAVICQDVKLLKEKFYSGVALSESISSGQTTCKLASSSSSLNSFNSDRAEVLKTPNKVLSMTSSVYESKAESEEECGQAEEETVANGRWQGLLEGGWELCV